MKNLYYTLCITLIEGYIALVKTQTIGRFRKMPILYVSEKMVRPERFELPTFWFVARRSIQLSYGRL